MWKAPNGPAGPLTPIGPADTVRFVTNDFMYGGGDGYTVFASGTNVQFSRGRPAPRRRDRLRRPRTRRWRRSSRAGSSAPSRRVDSDHEGRPERAGPRAESSRSSSSRGSRRVRVCALGVALLEPKRLRVGQRHEPPLADQRLVDRAEPARERRVDARAERGRLAVHRPAGRDDEVGQRDEALRVDRVLRDVERRQSERSDRPVAARPSAAARPRGRTRRGPAARARRAKSGLPWRW